MITSRRTLIAVCSVAGALLLAGCVLYALSPPWAGVGWYAYSPVSAGDPARLPYFPGGPTPWSAVEPWTAQRLSGVVLAVLGAVILPLWGVITSLGRSSARPAR